MNSSAIPAPTSTTTPTVPCAGIPNLDFFGLNGTICAASIPGSELNIEPCCTGTLRVVDNCTQYCEADPDDFRSCLSDLNNGTFVNSLCQPAPGNESNGSAPADTNAAGTFRPIFGTSAVGVVLSLAFVAVLL